MKEKKKNEKSQKDRIRKSRDKSDAISALAVLAIVFILAFSTLFVHGRRNEYEGNNRQGRVNTEKEDKQVNALVIGGAALSVVILTVFIINRQKNRKKIIKKNEEDIKKAEIERARERVMKARMMKNSQDNPYGVYDSSKNRRNGTGDGFFKNQSDHEKSGYEYDREEDDSGKLYDRHRYRKDYEEEQNVTEDDCHNKKRKKIIISAVVCIILAAVTAVIIMSVV